MDRKIHFLCGLPRSGSTLLANLFAQNPLVHATSTSGILQMMVNVRDFWPKIDAFASLPEEVTEKKKVQVLRGMLHGFFADVEQPVMIDKSRAWLHYMEMGERILGYKPKAIVTVRDIRDVLASFEKLYRKTSDTRLVGQEAGNPIDYQTVAGRCHVLTLKGQVVGACVEHIRDAVHRGWRNQMLFVEYETLTTEPERTMKRIYKFLDLPEFKHNFDHVEQLVDENDLVHVWKGLHKIRHKVEPQKPQYPDVLPKEVWQNYSDDAYFWRSL